MHVEQPWLGLWVLDPGIRIHTWAVAEVARPHFVLSVFMPQPGRIATALQRRRAHGHRFVSDVDIFDLSSRAAWFDRLRGFICSLPFLVFEVSVLLRGTLR